MRLTSRSQLLKILTLNFLVLAATLVSFAATINVPADLPTIQAAVNAAVNGDTVVVAPGAYAENINFGGKAITVTSSGGAAATIVDGGGLGAVFTFDTAETPSSVLTGFTIQNGGVSYYNFTIYGGGILMSNSSPTIKNNIIRNNHACPGGAGIGSEGGSPIIQANIIEGNYATQTTGCYGWFGGGGIFVTGGSAQIIGNIIQNNSMVTQGGGIGILGPATPVIRNNIIRSNSANSLQHTGGSEGGGIMAYLDTGSVITQNLIFGNRGFGSLTVYPQQNVPITTIVTNNTVVHGTPGFAGAVYVTGWGNSAQLYNNIIVGPPGSYGVYCDKTFTSQPPLMVNNDAYSQGGTSYAFACSSLNGQNGNISADPMFVNQVQRDFGLLAGSPAIDAGTNSAPNIPSRDLKGNPRIVDGNGDGNAVIDMGAYEFQ